MAQGHLVFGHGIAPQEENEYRVLSHVEPCFPGTLHMRQNSVLRWTTMIAQPPPLIEVFAELPDFRRCRGKRPPLPAILALVQLGEKKNPFCGRPSWHIMTPYAQTTLPEE
jgi:hypothetical protein